MVAKSRQAHDRTSLEFKYSDAALESTLDNLDGAQQYAAWILDLFSPYLSGRALEVGAGHGTFTELIAKRCESVLATDLSERCASVLESRFFGDGRVSVTCGTIEDLTGRDRFDCAVLINVLEHIEDDDGALASLAELLADGGRLLLWVPAFEFLYSDFDRRIGHLRRYHVQELRSKVAGTGLHVVTARYVNPVGALAWLVTARLLGRTPTDKGAVDIFDRHFVPWLRSLDRHFHPPFGQSVFLAGVKYSGQRGGARARR
jgi:SAM-dependent methyltransferase